MYRSDQFGKILKALTPESAKMGKSISIFSLHKNVSTVISLYWYGTKEGKGLHTLFSSFSSQAFAHSGGAQCSTWILWLLHPQSSAICLFSTHSSDISFLGIISREAKSKAFPSFPPSWPLWTIHCCWSLLLLETGSFNNRQSSFSYFPFWLLYLLPP